MNGERFLGENQADKSAWDKANRTNERGHFGEPRRKLQLPDSRFVPAAKTDLAGW
jgi:hypothetical protein